MKMESNHVSGIDLISQMSLCPLRSETKIGEEEFFLKKGQKTRNEIETRNQKRNCNKRKIKNANETVKNSSF